MDFRTGMLDSTSCFQYVSMCLMYQSVKASEPAWEGVFLYIMMLFWNTRQALSPCGPAIGPGMTARLPLEMPVSTSRPAV